VGLADQLMSDMKQAMRDGDSRRRDVIRFLRAAITNASIDKRADLSDDEIQGVIRHQIKQRRDSIEMFRAGGREELAQEEEAQLAILQAYLPPQLNEAELRAIVARVADELNVSAPNDMSRLMPAVMRETAGRAEGRVVSAMAREELARRSAKART
jgi:uncharacterized protein YqeY